MNTIYVNYANARAQARNLQSAASECAEVARNLRMALEQSSYAWEGEAADAFRSAVRRRLQETQQMEDTARALAQQILRVVEDLEEAERRVKNQIGSTGGR